MGGGESDTLFLGGEVDQMKIFFLIFLIPADAEDLQRFQ